MKLNFKDRAITSNKGFSLVEIMVAVGLLGIVSLGAMNLVQILGNAKKRGDFTLEVSQLGSSLSRHLYSAKGCSEFIGETFSSTASALTLNDWNFENKPSITEGTRFDKVTITNLKAKQELSGLPTVNVAGVDLIKTNLEVEVVVEYETSKSQFFYTVPVLSTTAGVIEHCGDQKNVVEICNSLLGNYNAITGRCDVAESCRIKGTYKVLSCSPSSYGCDGAFGPSISNIYTSALSCPLGSVPSQTGSESWSHNVSCGKKCTQTINNSAVWFTCLECP